MRINLEQYYADKLSPRTRRKPSLNAGVAITLLNKSPAHAWLEHPRLNPDYEPRNARHYDIGRAFHTSVLGEGDSFTVLDYPDYRSKAAREDRQAAYDEGVTPLLKHEYEPICRMVESANRAILKSGYDTQWDRGKSEQGYYVTVDGCPCRALADRICTTGNVIFDLKSTAGIASPEAWIRDGMKFGIDVRVAHYLDVIGKEFRKKYAYVLVVVEKSPPYASAVFRLSDRLIALGRSKIAFAREQWLKCLAGDKWPAWPGDVQELDAAEYHYTNWMYRLQLAGKKVPVELETDIVL